MLRDITVGQYYPGNSILHRLDPRTKLIGTFLFIIVIFMVKTSPQYLLLGLFVLLNVFLSKVPLRFIIRGLRSIVFILMFAFAINLFFTPGTPIFRLWRIRITHEGLRLAFTMMMRLVLLIMGTSLMTLTSSPIQLTDGIERLFSPLKRVGFPAHEVAMMMSIALRFIPTLLEETDKIMKAQMARGADFESGRLLQRARALVPLLVPLFIASFKRADDLANAMEARCYRGGRGRTRLHELRYSSRDFLAFLTLAFLTAGVYVLGII
ncbi:MAG: energy-coupling factor transporter transmembrane protein EcfT [Tissierellia bacterium]|nr:energy-coupling factor transporter transmembrane component T [Bacillota bacterium]NLL23348.1 energy-coupling factor transporter transmembrane protein EcfT [Tissierellia bacterium]